MCVVSLLICLSVSIESETCFLPPNILAMDRTVRVSKNVIAVYVCNCGNTIQYE